MPLGCRNWQIIGSKHQSSSLQKSCVIQPATKETNNKTPQVCTKIRKRKEKSSTKQTPLGCLTTTNSPFTFKFSIYLLSQQVTDMQCISGNLHKLLPPESYTAMRAKDKGLRSLSFNDETHLLFWRDCNSSLNLCLAFWGKVYISIAIVVNFIHIYANTICFFCNERHIHKPKTIILLSSNVFYKLWRKWDNLSWHWEGTLSTG